MPVSTVIPSPPPEQHEPASTSVYACAISPSRTRYSPLTAEPRILHFYGMSTNVVAKTLLWLGLMDFHMTFTFLNTVPRCIIAAWENTSSTYSYSYARRGRNYSQPGNWKMRGLIGVSSLALGRSFTPLQHSGILKSCCYHLVLYFLMLDLFFTKELPQL